MKTAMVRERTPSAQVDYVSTQLLTRAALLTRLAIRQVSARLTRTEAGVLNTLKDGPQRITALAELEGLAQPTITLLVKRLEEQGLVDRERNTQDGRVVMVCLTASGAAALENFIAQVRAALCGYVAELPKAQIDALASATDALEDLIGLLQQGPNR
jgi:DNA-binding MarR family transcriptional regulator